LVPRADQCPLAFTEGVLEFRFGVADVVQRPDLQLAEVGYATEVEAAVDFGADGNMID